MAQTTTVLSGFIRADAPPHPERFIDTAALRALDPKALISDRVTKDIRASVLEYEYSGEWGEAQDYSLALTELLKKSSAAKDQSRLLQYEEILLLCQWVSYPFLIDIAERQLLRLHLLIALENRINIRKKFLDRLTLEAAPEAVHPVRLGFINAMRANTELIGTEKIKIKGIDDFQQPSIQNWLSDYEQQYSQEEGRAAIEEAGYVNNGQNASHLSTRDRGALLQLLKAYDFLFFPDLQQDVLPMTEAPSGRTYQARTPSEAQPQIQASGRASYDYRAVRAQAQQLLRETGGNEKRIIQSLVSDLQDGSAVNAMASLLLLAQLRMLDNVVAGEPRFQSMVRDDLKKGGHDDMVQGLRANPRAPQFLARFLSIALEERLGLLSYDALDFGSHLASLLSLKGDQYARLVINEGGKMRWNQ